MLLFNPYREEEEKEKDKNIFSTLEDSTVIFLSESVVFDVRLVS